MPKITVLPFLGYGIKTKKRLLFASVHHCEKGRVSQDAELQGFSKKLDSTFGTSWFDEVIDK